MQQLVLSTEWVSRFRRGVRRWYAAHGRKLPWVGQRDPYAVWVREIMLQQTTVTAVVPYLDRFLDRFPMVEVLASAELDEVLRAWEGLGYYSRARNLHKASRMIVEEWGGVWRETALELEALPGVGRYTAGAIASFAFDQPAAIVEANTARLFARLMALDSDLAQSASRRQLWSLAERVVPRGRPGDGAAAARGRLDSAQRRGPNQRTEGRPDPSRQVWRRQTHLAVRGCAAPAWHMTGVMTCRW